ncbi:MAG: DNA mismatch repair protein MutS, partial [Candidatus Dormibacteraceae bacterium]
MVVTLTSRPLREGRHPMCGVPHHAWESYVGKLLRAGKKVVLCDQVEPPGGKGVVRREVTRVLTPGTVVEESYLEPARSNWLVAAVSSGNEAGLAACDISTGELQLCQLPAERLPAELARLAPAELLTAPEVEPYRFDPERGKHRLAELLGITVMASIGAEKAPLAVGAAGVVLDYLENNQVRLAPGLLRVFTYSPDETMQLDQSTIKNLELDSLLRLIDRSKTPIGARRLRRWLWAPLREIEAIELRLGAVQELVQGLGEKLAASLAPVGDLERLLSRAAQGLAGPRELVQLRRSLEALPEVIKTARQATSHRLRQLIDSVEYDGALAAELARALVEDPHAMLREGGAIRPGYDAELDRIQEASREAREWISGLEAAERERSGIKSLKVGFNKIFGYYLEVSHANSELVPADYLRKQTLTGGERYITPELKERETVVLNAQQDRLERELVILHQLQEQVAMAVPQQLGWADVVGELDALSALANAASELGWIRPMLSKNLELTIQDGRHPVIEQVVGAGGFVANPTNFDTAGTRIVILTGPNMAGKSTYLRQVALIVLLAQCGSFVPAATAAIGITDRIFTRVGAHDDLAAGMSTFMVEMAETANILNHAT